MANKITQTTGSNRTTYIIVAVVAIVIISAGIIGGWFFWQNAIRWQYENQPIEYHFDEVAPTPPELITLNINLVAGVVNITFVDNATLIYRMDVTANRLTVDQHGDPTVSYASNTITFNYAAAAADIFLGSGANYSINTDTNAGSIRVIAGQFAHLDDVSLEATAGIVQFDLTSTATLNGNITVTLSATTGPIYVNVALPSGASGSFTGASNIGPVSVTPSSPWSEVSATEYETSDFGSTANSIDIMAHADIGSVTATLS
ncbi:MAG: hypothetical protein ACFE9D_00190 [Promethearchaeota archaeon]